MAVDSERVSYRESVSGVNDRRDVEQRERMHTVAVVSS